MTWDQHSRGSSLTNPAVGAASLAMHAAVIFGAIGATLKVARRDAAVRVDTAVVFLEPPRPAPGAAPKMPRQGRTRASTAAWWQSASLDARPRPPDARMANPRERC
jgi:hypothetical protein